jgi:hypothetical protein
VAVVENCGNHKKPPATMQAVCLTLALEAATLFFDTFGRLAALRVKQARGRAGRLIFCFRYCVNIAVQSTRFWVQGVYFGHSRKCEINRNKLLRHRLLSVLSVPGFVISLPCVSFFRFFLFLPEFFPQSFTGKHRAK